jgi:WhiB family redox-sensing transcriptional regulator
MIAVTSIGPITTWRDHAECRGVDPGIFHPDDEDENEFSSDAAKAICMQCPVREPCLEHAIAVREKHGVWGGLTARERRRLIRRRRRSA